MKVTYIRRWIHNKKAINIIADQRRVLYRDMSAGLQMPASACFIVYLASMIIPVSRNFTRRHLRSAVLGDLVNSRIRTAVLGFGPRSLSAAGPSSWNSLPSELIEEDVTGSWTVL